VTAVAERVRHFVSIADLEPDELGTLLDLTARLKADRSQRSDLRGRTVALVFEKPSLRTRLSFDVGTAQLGGHSVYLSPAEVGLGRRESVADVARVVSRMADAVVLRVNAHETIEEFAKFSGVPVINGLSDLSHPCQGLADIFTIRERKGRGADLRGVVVAYVGDGNNVAHSLMLCAAKTGVSLRIATWAALALELTFAPLALFRRARPWIWTAMVGLHTGLLLLVSFADLTAGMVLVHLFTFNPAWVGPRTADRSVWIFYDGHCALCQGWVRFALAEDTDGKAFRISPLQGRLFATRIPAEKRTSLPDSLVVLTEDDLLVRSAARL